MNEQKESTESEVAQVEVKRELRSIKIVLACCFVLNLTTIVFFGLCVDRGANEIVKLYRRINILAEKLESKP